MSLTLHQSSTAHSNNYWKSIQSNAHQPFHFPCERIDPVNRWASVWLKKTRSNLADGRCCISLSIVTRWIMHRSIIIGHVTVHWPILMIKFYKKFKHKFLQLVNFKMFVNIYREISLWFSNVFFCVLSNLMQRQMAHRSRPNESFRIFDLKWRFSLTI